MIIQLTKEEFKERILKYFQQDDNFFEFKDNMTDLKFLGFGAKGEILNKEFDYVEFSKKIDPVKINLIK